MVGKALNWMICPGGICLYKHFGEAKALFSDEISRIMILGAKPCHISHLGALIPVLPAGTWPAIGTHV